MIMRLGCINITIARDTRSINWIPKDYMKKDALEIISNFRTTFKNNGLL